MLAVSFSTGYIVSLSIVPGSGFNNVTGGIIQVDVIDKGSRRPAVICDFDRQGRKLDARMFCYALGQ